MGWARLSWRMIVYDFDTHGYGAGKTVLDGGYHVADIRLQYCTYLLNIDHIAFHKHHNPP
jgi:hypothetical protein